MKGQEEAYRANMGAKDGEIKHLQVVKGTVIQDEGAGGGLQGQHGGQGLLRLLSQLRLRIRPQVDYWAVEWNRGLKQGTRIVSKADLLFQ
jgi:hypothetical protein